MKKCNACKETKGLAEFSKSKSTPDGLDYKCKVCRRAYYTANRDRLTQRSKELYQEHVDQKRQQKKDNYRSDPEKYKLRSKIWRQNNPERRKQQMASWIALNSERKKLVLRDWQRRNPGKVTAGAQRRRARQRQLRHTYTDTDWSNTLEQWGHACAYCGKVGEKLQQEHFIPVSLGGHYEVGNIVPACKKCNCSKRALAPDQWLSPEKYAYVLGHLL